MLLGVITPDEGSIEIAGDQPQHARGRTPLPAGGVRVRRSRCRRRDARAGRATFRPRRSRERVPPPRRGGTSSGTRSNTADGASRMTRDRSISWLRIRAMARRHYYVLLRAPHRWFDVTIWPLVDVLLFGSIGVFITQSQHAT